MPHFLRFQLVSTLTSFLAMAGEETFLTLFLDFVFRLFEGAIRGDDWLRESKTTVGIPGIPIGIEFEFWELFVLSKLLPFILEFESSRNRSNFGIEEKCMIDGGGFWTLFKL